MRRIRGLVPSAVEGFTLLELIVAVAIVLIISSLAAVSLGGFASSRRMKGSARDFTNLVYLAQERAVSAGRLQRLVIDLDEEDFFLEEITLVTDEGYFRRVPLPTFRDVKRKGVDLYQVDTSSSGKAYEEGIHYLYFSPEGEVSPAEVTIRNERDICLCLKIFSTGRVKIEKE